MGNSRMGAKQTIHRLCKWEHFDEKELYAKSKRVLELYRDLCVQCPGISRTGMDEPAPGENEKDIVAPVIGKIDKLPDAVSLDDEEAIQEAREEYDALTDSQKELVSSVSLEKLAAAEESLTSLKKQESEALRQSESDQNAADEAIQKIQDLPDEITLDDESAIQDALENYDKLTEEQKTLVPSTSYERLINATAELDALQKEASEAKTRSGSSR